MNNRELAEWIAANRKNLRPDDWRLTCQNPECDRTGFVARAYVDDSGTRVLLTRYDGLVGADGTRGGDWAVPLYAGDRGSVQVVGTCRGCYAKHFIIAGPDQALKFVRFNV